jgi:p-aminobenzoyl-glutamate transporter AbgT
MATADSTPSSNLIIRFLNLVEWAGNKLPDPAVLFLIGIAVVAVGSLGLSQLTFSELDPRSQETIKVVNMLSLPEFATLLTTMVKSFVEFPPLGVVLVALLGVGVAEKAGFINALLKAMLSVTPQALLTPMVILVAIVSHTAADAGYVLVIPLAGIMFYAAGRHPLAGIAAAFAGVSGGFSANFVPSGIDPLLAALTEVGAKIYDPGYSVNPLCNWYFTAASSFLIILVGWAITDLLIEPKLRSTPVDGDPDAIPQIAELTARDYKALGFGLGAMVLGILLFTAWALPLDSSLRDPLGNLASVNNRQTAIGLDLTVTNDGVKVQGVQPKSAAAAAGLATGDLIVTIAGKPVQDLLAEQPLELHLKADRPVIVESVRDGATRHTILTPKPIPGAPLISSIVPLIFILFFIPGIVHGYLSGNFTHHRDVIAGMSKAMESMAYYLVLVFFVAMFIYVFNRSGIGLLLAVKGAESLRGQPAVVIICGIVLLSGCVNLLIGSASAKWAMLAPIFVPMLMSLGISPEFAQAAYRVGDSSTNIITPLLPYFPLVVVFGQRYHKATGIGTITSLMLPYSLCFLVLWTAFLLIYWQIGWPLGVAGGYEYVRAN